MASLLLITLLLALVGCVLAQLPPNIPQTWQLNRSTIAMPCNYTGFLDGTPSPFAIVDIDWSNNKGMDGRSGWAAAHPMDCEEDMVLQAQALKAKDPSKTVWVYRCVYCARRCACREQKQQQQQQQQQQKEGSGRGAARAHWSFAA
jgi:hypothetical protein